MNEDEILYSRKDIFRILTYWEEIDYLTEITENHFLKWGIESIMPHLPSSYQTTFQLWIQGYSTNEMANLLKTTEGNILKRKYRLTKRLYEEINEE